MGRIIIPSEKKRKPNHCCNIASNLYKYKEGTDVEVEVCRVCGCRHTRFHVDPLNLRMKTG